jgi:hypothetical protein
MQRLHSLRQNILGFETIVSAAVGDRRAKTRRTPALRAACRRGDCLANWFATGGQRIPWRQVLQSARISPHPHNSSHDVNGEHPRPNEGDRDDDGAGCDPGDPGGLQVSCSLAAPGFSRATARPVVRGCGLTGAKTTPRPRYAFATVQTRIAQERPQTADSGPSCGLVAGLN